MAKPTLTQAVGANEIRRRFNEADIEGRVGRDLRLVVRVNRHPSQPKAQEPFCTKSQLVAYVNGNGQEVARAHRYLRKDGTIGASGRADPKELRDGQNLYVYVPDLD